MGLLQQISDRSFPRETYFFFLRQRVEYIPESWSFFSLNMSDSEELNSGLFTCMACQVAFRSSDGQSNHYRSDWHRYNLKRKAADLPPITAAQFDQKLQG